MRRARCAATAPEPPRPKPQRERFQDAVRELLPELRVTEALYTALGHRTYIGAIPRDLFHCIADLLPHLRPIQAIHDAYAEPTAILRSDFIQKINEHCCRLDREWLGGRGYNFPKCGGRYHRRVYILHNDGKIIMLNTNLGMNQHNPATLTITSNGETIYSRTDPLMCEIAYHGMDMLFITRQKATPLYLDLRNLHAVPREHKTSYQPSSYQNIILPCGLMYSMNSRTMYNARTGKVIHIGPKGEIDDECRANEAVQNSRAERSIIDDNGNVGIIAPSQYVGGAAEYYRIWAYDIYQNYVCE